MTIFFLVEDEDAPPQLAKLKLKKFYHDKESEEVLKVCRMTPEHLVPDPAS